MIRKHLNFKKDKWDKYKTSNELDLQFENSKTQGIQSLLFISLDFFPFSFSTVTLMVENEMQEAKEVQKYVSLKFRGSKSKSHGGGGWGEHYI